MSLNEFMSVGGNSTLEQLLAERRDEMQNARKSDEPASTDELLLGAALTYVQIRRQNEDDSKRREILRPRTMKPPTWGWILAFGLIVVALLPLATMQTLAALKTVTVLAGVFLAAGAGASLSAHPDNVQLDAVGKIVTYVGAVLAACAAFSLLFFGA